MTLPSTNGTVRQQVVTVKYARRERRAVRSRRLGQKASEDREQCGQT